MTRRQLSAAGVTFSMINRRIASGHLITIHRGVYAPGHAHLTRHGRRLAAVLAAGPGAALSHRSAGALHGILSTAGTWIEVTATTRGTTDDRLRVYGRRALARADVTTVDGIPATTVARTLVDLADVLPARRLRNAFEETERIRAFDLHALEAALARTRGRKGPGAAAIRALLAETAAAGARHTRSELEDRFLALLDDHGLPRPLTNAWVEGMEVDALWADKRVVVELDSYEWHNTRQAFQRDRTRANDLVGAGYEVMRFTWADVVRDAAATARLVTRALAAAPRPRRSAPPAP